MKSNNLILLADAYKYSHHKLYYPGTEFVYSYLESRGGLFDKTLFFGLQYFIKEFLAGKVITPERLEEADPILENVFGRTDVFDPSKFQYIIDQHGGRLPVKIRAVPEGLIVPTRQVLLTIENTDPACYWLPNFLETLLMQIWYPCTVGTLSYQVRKLLLSFYNRTADEAAVKGIEWVLNDFGFRGVSSVESAGIGGAAHLLNFRGSDNLAASLFAMQYYHAAEVYGRSVPATEHSVCTLLGEEGELDIFRHVVDCFPTGTVACVSDSYDIFRACAAYWGTELKQQILSRDGVLVIRPDSGDPTRTLLAVFDILFEKFGYTVNQKGFKVLPPQVRVLQGDGVDYFSINEIFTSLEEAGISAENLLLGMGGALLQRLDRDTQKFALKCSWAQLNGKGIDVSKQPLEMDANGNIQPSFKISKAGKFQLVKEGDQFKTVSDSEGNMPGLLRTVFENGTLLIDENVETIRDRIWNA